VGKSKRTLEIVLSGEAVLDGRVSVPLFTKTLQSIQEVVVEIGKSEIQRDPTKRGPAPTAIKRACELFLIGTEPGSLRALVELPEKEETLFPDFPDFAESVLDNTKNTLDAIVKQDDKKFYKCIPNSIYRRRILQKVIKIAPTEDSDYRLEIGTEDEKPIRLIRPPKEAIALLEAFSAETIEEGPDIRRSVVEAKGLAEIFKGNITKWIETYDMEELEFDFQHAWRPRKIKAAGKVFHLVHHIACAIEKQEGLFVSEYEPFGILAYGETREEVMRAFSHEFAILWDAIAQEDDRRLTEDARTLKKKFLELVEEVKVYEPEENEGY